jgi:hypothetical protein
MAGADGSGIVWTAVVSVKGLAAAVAAARPARKT